MARGISVKITKNNVLLFEKSSQDGPRSIGELTNHLKDIQQNVNDFLTTLVDADRKEFNRGANESDEDESDDTDDDLDGVNPKKCRLTD